VSGLDTWLLIEESAISKAWSEGASATSREALMHAAGNRSCRNREPCSVLPPTLSRLAPLRCRESAGDRSRASVKAALLAVWTLAVIVTLVVVVVRARNGISAT
jgi:hypothetical protein